MRATVIGFSLLLLTFASQLKAGEQIDASSIFEDWAAFFDEDLCWVASHPQDADGEGY